MVSCCVYDKPKKLCLGSGCDQCDQNGRFIALSLWQQLIYPNLLHSLAIFVKVSKSIIFLANSFLGNFYRHLAIFSDHTDCQGNRLKAYTRERIIRFIASLTMLLVGLFYEYLQPTDQPLDKTNGS